MYRQVLTPTQENNTIVIPNKWYGQVEPTTFKQRKRFALDALLDRYLLDLSDFKFNRDEANDYD
jgi:hypothetical protein